MDKKILVLGATGQQGTAAATRLIANKFQVKAFTRNAKSQKSLALQNLGAEIFEGNLENENDIEAAMGGVFGVFLVLPPQWNPTQETDTREWLTGKLIIDIAKRNNVQQIVYSSVMGSELQLLFRPLFKFNIEEYLKQSEIAYTILKPAAFYENFYMPQYGLADHRIYNPLPAQMKLPFISVEDIGAFTLLALQKPEVYAGKTLNITGELLTSAELAAIFSETLSVSINPVEVPLEVVKSQNELLGQFMEALSEKGYPEIDVEEFKQLHPELLSLKEWSSKYGKERLLHIVRK